MRKIGLGFNVLDAAKSRIIWSFDNSEKLYVSFSAGKDSSVLLHLAAQEARRRKRKIGVLLVDLEAQYALTIQHGEKLYKEYSDVIEPYWISLPIILRNAVSVFQPNWLAWDPDQKEIWVRQPPAFAITNEKFFPFFHKGMEFEEFVPAFGNWYSQGKPTACLIGIRSDESLNRFRTLVMEKARIQDKPWTTQASKYVFNAYPIYDWRTEDIWTYHGKTGESYNQIYDLMYKAGLSIHQMRLCQPYGSDQRKGLYLFHILEPNTWHKVVARVAGANTGAFYAHESCIVFGNRKIDKPAGMTWRQFTYSMLESIPPSLKEHYENKIYIFLKWWKTRGYPDDIPDEEEKHLESNRAAPSWRRIARALLKNDYWCKSLSFNQTKSDLYEKYMKVMKEKRASG